MVVQHLLWQPLKWLHLNKPRRPVGGFGLKQRNKIAHGLDLQRTCSDHVGFMLRITSQGIAFEFELSSKKICLSTRELMCDYTHAESHISPTLVYDFVFRVYTRQTDLSRASCCVGGCWLGFVFAPLVFTWGLRGGRSPATAEYN